MDLEHKTNFPWMKATDPMIYKTRKDWPLISIITPSLNQGVFIEETIRSILLQNYPNLEYIIIDGGSTDNTLDIIKKYSPWISYWESTPDAGQTNALNKGLKRSSGEIVTWINSDDLLATNALFKVSEYFRRYQDADFIYGLPYILKNDNELELNYTPENEKELEYLGSFPYTQPSCFFKYDILKVTGLLDESFNIAMDYDLFVKISLNGKMRKINEMLGVFRIQNNAKTYTYTTEWDNERVRVFSKLLRTLNVKNSWLDHLEQCSIYIPGKDKYPSRKKISEDQVNKIIRIFIRDHLMLNFYAKKFNVVYYLSKRIRKSTPFFFQRNLKIIHLKAKIYRNPILFYLSRPLAYFWRKIKKLVKYNSC